VINISEELGLKLFEIADFKESYYKLHDKFKKMHKKFTVLPFLVKLNLRKPPKGMLTDELIEEIAKAYVMAVRGENINFDLVVGLPNAGVPFAEAFVRIWNNFYPDKKGIIYLDKEETESYRRILPNITGEYHKGQNVFLIDDVISLAESKIEATGALRSNDLVVTHGAALLDWELGGVEFLAKEYGVRLLVLYKASRLLSIWYTGERISLEKCRQIIDRVRKIKKQIEAYSLQNVH